MFPSTVVLRLSLLAGAVGMQHMAAPPMEGGATGPVQELQPPPKSNSGGADPIAKALAVVAGGLTADDAARRAVESGPTIAQASAQLRAAVAQVDALRKSFTPALNLEASYARLSQVESGIPIDDMAMAVVGDVSFDIPLNQYSLNATLGLPVSDWLLRLIPSLSAGKAGSRAAEFQRDAEMRTVATDARVAYYGWLRATAQVAVGEASLARSQARLKDAQVGVRAGMMSPADVMRIDALVARTEASLEGARAVERVAKRTLAVLMGEDLEMDFQIGDNVMIPPERDGSREDLKATVARGLADRPELAALGANVEQAEASIKARRAEYYPRVAAFGEAVYANPNRRFFPLANEWNQSWALGASVSWSLDVAVVNSARVEELKANRERASSTREQLRRGVTLEIVNAYETRARAEASLDANERGKASAEEAYRVMSVRYANGTATTTDVINSEFDRVDAALALVRNQLDLLEAQARLEFATGDARVLD